MSSRHFAPPATELEPADGRLSFDTRFDRCRRMLLLIASRVLGAAEDAERAVANCRAAASRNPPAFSSEPAYRSWLARVLIDEALTILRERSRTH